MSPTVTILILLLVLPVSTAPAQTYGWMDLSANMPESGNFKDVHFFGDEGWIAGGNGKIYHTTDGGQSFTNRVLPANSGISSSLFMRSPTEGYTVTYGGYVLHTTDKGEHWTTFGGPLGVGLNSIAFPPMPDTTGYTCGNAGRIFSVTPSGIHFDTNISTYTMTSLVFPVSSAQGWLVGQMMWHRTTQGWVDSLSYPAANYYNAVHFVDNSHGWAVAVSGRIIFTTNGIDWNGQPNADQNTLNDVFFLNVLEGWAVGQNVLLHTTDGGSHWNVEAHNLTEGKILTSVFALNSTTVYAVGNYTLLKYGNLDDVKESAHQLPSSVYLSQNYPNPFNPSTTIEYALTPIPRLTGGQASPNGSTTRLVERGEKGVRVTLRVYDVLGREVTTLVNEMKSPGRYNIVWNAAGIASGVYFYKCEANGRVELKRMLVMK